MYQVYVQANDGTPLMPTTRFRKVKHLLREGMAKVVYAKPLQSDCSMTLRGSFNRYMEE